MDFVRKTGLIKTVPCTKDSSTVIEAGDLVGISSGLIVKATEATTKLGWAPKGAGDGETTVEVTMGNDFTLTGTADANFAVTDKGAEVDLVIASTVQKIDLGTSTTDVLLVAIAEDAGTVGSTANVEVKINKPLF